MSAPSQKQINYLASLIGTSSSYVWQEIGKRLNISASAAKSRATSADISRLIDEAKAAQ